MGLGVAAGPGPDRRLEERVVRNRRDQACGELDRMAGVTGAAEDAVRLGFFRLGGEARIPPVFHRLHEHVEALDPGDQNDVGLTVADLPAGVGKQHDRGGAAGQRLGGLDLRSPIPSSSARIRAGSGTGQETESTTATESRAASSGRACRSAAGRPR